MPNHSEGGTRRAGPQRSPTWLVLLMIISIVVAARWYRSPANTPSTVSTGDSSGLPEESTTATSPDPEIQSKSRGNRSSEILPDEGEPQVPELAPDAVSGSRPVDSPNSAATDPPSPLKPLRKSVGSRGPPEGEESGAAVPSHAPRNGIGTDSRSAKSGVSWHQVEGQTIRDLSGKVVFKGTIDLKPTLDRIQRGDSNRHRNDGSTFQNREGRLPRKPNGYYKEYVHPTSGERGPGPQRVIVGRDGDIWYTPDHYKTFKRLKSDK